MLNTGQLCMLFDRAVFFFNGILKMPKLLMNNSVGPQCMLGADFVPIPNNVEPP